MSFWAPKYQYRSAPPLSTHHTLLPSDIIFHLSDFLPVDQQNRLRRTCKRYLRDDPGRRWFNRILRWMLLRERALCQRMLDDNVCDSWQRRQFEDMRNVLCDRANWSLSQLRQARAAREYAGAWICRWSGLHQMTSATLVDTLLELYNGSRFDECFRMEYRRIRREIFINDEFVWDSWSGHLINGFAGVNLPVLVYSDDASFAPDEPYLVRYYPLDWHPPERRAKLDAIMRKKWTWEADWNRLTHTVK